MRIAHSLVIAACLLCTAIASADTNWPRFRGPTGQGISDSTGLPLHWNESRNVVWKTPIHGRAWSSPVIWKNQVWLTTATEDGRQRFAVCVDRDSGKIVFDEMLFDVPTPQYIHPFNSYASPTPVIEEGRIYVTFGSAGTACLDTSDGKVLWQRTDFVCNHFRGAGSSPLLIDNLLVMNFDGSDFQYVVALDKHTGQTVWQKTRSMDYQDLQPDGSVKAQGDWRKAFSTPIEAHLGGQELIISLGSKAYYAYEPLTGREIWRYEYRPSYSASATPVIGNGIIYICSGFGQAMLLALRPDDHRGLLTDAQVVWKQIRHVPNKPSPLLVKGRLYLITDSGIASAVDAQKGQPVWHSRIDGDFSASPTYADGHIFFCSENGTTTVVDAGDQFNVLAQNTLADGMLASPAIAGKALFLRTRTALYRIEQR